MRAHPLLLFVGMALLCAAMPTPNAPPVTGKVAILDNNQLLEGDLVREGEQYRIRRTIGETWIPANRIVFLGPDRLSAYEYLQKRANLRDVDERMRLTRWCLQHALRPQALVEAKAALALRPKDREIQQMVHALEQTLANSPAPTPVVPETVETPSNTVEEIPAPADFNNESISLFVTKVQPILMNTCATCHAQESMKGFKLVRVFEGNQSRRLMQQNLSATLAQLDRVDVSKSPLLIKAITPHGNVPKAPIRDRESVMYRTLEVWSQFAMVRSGGQIESPMPTAPPMSDGSVPPLAPVSFGQDRGPSPVVPRVPVIGAPKVQPGESDPFDPALFNGPAK